MNTWIKFSLKNAGFIFLLMFMILIGGIYAGAGMKMEEMPSVDIPYLTVVVPYPGATPEQALEDVGKPLEQALLNVDNVKNLYITAGNGYVSSMMEFTLDQSMLEAERAVNSALAGLKLPEGAQQPRLSSEGPANVPVYSFSVTGDADQAEVQEYVDEEIKPMLNTVEGISKINVYGTDENKLFVRLDPEKLAEYNLTFDKVKQTLLANNISVPAGEVTLDGRSLNVEVSQRIQSLEDLENVQLVVIDQDVSELTKAFDQIGSGFDQLGTAMVQLGQGMGDLATSQGILQAELQVMQGIDGLAAAMYADQAALAQLNQQLLANPDQAAQLQPEIAGLEQKIEAEKQQIAALQAQLTALQAQAAAAGQSLEQSLGALEKSSTPAPVNTAGAGQLGYEIRTVQLKDIAEISYGPGSNSSITRLNGEPAVVTNILAEPGTNTVELNEQIEAELAALTLPSGYELTTLHDSSTSVKKLVYSMLREGLLGALFAALVTFVFLRNLRSTSVAIIAIPLSIFATLIVLYLLDYSLNVMTLAGLTVAIGRVIDDSIVVMENIYRRLKQTEERTTDVIVDATKEVGKAVTFSTITTIAVFAPLAFVPGIVGKYFVPFAIAVVIALIFSLLVAISVVPLLSNLFLKNMKHVEPKENWLQKGYRVVLDWSLTHKLSVAVISLAMIAATLALIPQIPQNFLPAEKTVSYGLKVTLPNGTSISEVDKVARGIEQELGDRTDLENYQTYVRGEQISIQIELHDSLTLEETKKFEQEIREFTDNLGSDISAALTPQSITSYGGGLYIIINGDDWESLERAGDMIVEAIKDVPGLADVSTDVAAETPQISTKIDSEAAARNALNPGMIGMSVREMISGDDIMEVSLDGRSTAVNLALDTENLSSLDVISDQKITNMVGEQVRLGDVATVSEEPGPTSLHRLNQQAYVSVTGQLTTDNASGVQKEVEKQIAALDLPEGVTYYFEGEAKAMDDGFRDMAVAIIIAILLVYLVMIIGFQQMLAPFAILFSLPFIFVGGLWGLFITGESMGTPGLLGFLMLIGIVVTNSIVLLDRALNNARSGMRTQEALIEAGVTRLRPILMTAFATIGALLPLAVSSEGGIISRSMAIVVIFGLTTTTLMSLVIVPVAYDSLDSWRNRVLHRRTTES